jgi:methylated-DNA-[protein]-cysteine S-methyltransferase
MTDYWDRLETSICSLTVTVNDDREVVAIQCVPDRQAPSPSGATRDPSRCAPAIEQLREYFEGDRRQFDLVLRAEGTAFQRKVWQIVGEIPYGCTVSYGELAVRLGDPKTVRAVGRANGANPIPIVVPCHRVLGADGSLVGYGGGLHLKRALLELERALLPADAQQRFDFSG